MVARTAAITQVKRSKLLAKQQAVVKVVKQGIVVMAAEVGTVAVKLCSELIEFGLTST